MDYQTKSIFIFHILITHEYKKQKLQSYRIKITNFEQHCTWPTTQNIKHK